MNDLILLSDSYLIKYVLTKRKSYLNYLNSWISVYFSPITDNYYLLDDDDCLVDWFRDSDEVSDYFYNNTFVDCVDNECHFKGECVVDE